jgi:hypothetical protein
VGFPGCEQEDKWKTRPTRKIAKSQPATGWLFHSLNAMIDETHVRELLRIKGQNLFHREGQELEFKEQFNLAGLADYFRDFAAFANNKGGYLVFGVKDSPRIPIGLAPSSLESK